VVAAFFLELIQDSLPVAKTGLFFVSFCVFEGAKPELRN